MRRRISILTLPFLLASIVGSTSPSAADPLPAPIDCPEYLTVEEVSALPRETELSGFTVASGVDPEGFSASLLGVMDDAIAPGRSMIVIEATGSEIDENGIWAGMSGSPVYHDDKLIGAVAFGLTWGPSNVAGLTPAEDMFELPGAGSPTTTSTTNVALTPSMQRRIASSQGSSTYEGSDSMTQLKLPLAVSGGQRALARLSGAVEKEGLPFLPYLASSSTQSVPLEATEAGAGGSLGAGLSFGDITIAAVGTTTFVCDGKAVGFGHPFTWQGRTALGATGADTLKIVGDPQGGSYKLANLTEPIGTVVEDRLAGIVANLGGVPAMASVNSDTTALDLGRTIEGETQVVDQDIFPYLTFIHLLANIDSTFDQISRGSSEVGWTISGTRNGGVPWTLTRSNKYASWYDIAISSVDEIYNQLYSLQTNGFENVKITDVDLTTSVEERVRLYQISKVLSSKNGTTFRDRDTLRVRRGQDVWFKIVFRGISASPPTNTIVKMRVPRTRYGSGTVRFRSGAPRSSYYFDECFFDECGPVEEASTSFDDVLADLAGKSTNDQLIASMEIGSRDREKRTQLDRVIRGSDKVRLRIVR
jgi:hypothetical protein